MTDKEKQAALARLTRSVHNGKALFMTVRRSDLAAVLTLLKKGQQE